MYTLIHFMGRTISMATYQEWSQSYFTELTSDQVQSLQQMFGDLASLEYDDKYNDDFGSDVFNQLWDKITKM